ncbi:CASP-like protein 2D1 [Musa acuminata AAA Group]|uniref:CASP-like protein n=1 Tax=Musa acuminata subsp. malaccensis TaxID=214687 RepID=A0A804IZ37_MUSAM|nr:PREDICTED: CASP-like protein 2D1 [Musa acuminata subsp. malaccensis]CAG1844799.1 unnamed protein product [Musa acuminata subsp. malaccensis]
MGDQAESTLISSNNHQVFRVVGLSLRLAAIPLCAASLWVMATNKQANESYGKVEFSDLPGLRYMVCISAISLGYSVVSILFACLGCVNNDWFFFISDQVVAYLMVTSGSAVAEVLYLAREGDRKASWSEACSYYGRFCDRTKVSLALHLAALLCFIALFLVSSYTVFSKFEAPSVSDSSKGVGE